LVKSTSPVSKNEKFEKFAAGFSQDMTHKTGPEIQIRILKEIATNIDDSKEILPISIITTATKF